MSSHGFTLLELMVVLAVIAVLAMLLVPMASRAMDSAYQVECSDNLRSIAPVYHLYAADHAFRLPSKDMLGNSSYRMLTDPLGLPHHFAPYVATNKVWMCPRGRKTLKPFGNNYAWSRAQALVADSGGAQAYGNAPDTTVVWDNFTYALPSVWGVPEGPSGGPQAVTAVLRYYPHARKKLATYLQLDGHIVIR